MEPADREEVGLTDAAEEGALVRGDQLAIPEQEGAPPCRAPPGGVGTQPSSQRCAQAIRDSENRALEEVELLR